GPLAHETKKKIEGHPVLSPLRNDDVGKALGRLYERDMHGPNAVVVLPPDLGKSAAAVLQIAADAPHEPDVRVGIDEQRHLEPGAQALVGEDEDPFDDDDRRGLDREALLQSIVDREVVRRARDRLTRT